MLCDAHVHVGQFYDMFTSPSELSAILHQVGVSKCAVSSTSIAEENYPKVVSEISDFINIFGVENVSPVLWTTPSMLKSDATLDYFVDQNIDWKCVKVHTELHPEEWDNFDWYIDKVVSLASILHVPILIHTGESCLSRPECFEKAIAQKPNQLFVLAHGRPLDSTVFLLKHHDNVYVDTAFMPLSNIIKLCNKGFSDRVLWGTDIPIPICFYPGVTLVDYSRERITFLRNVLSESSFQKLTYCNYQLLYGQQNASFSRNSSDA